MSKREDRNPEIASVFLGRVLKNEVQRTAKAEDRSVSSLVRRAVRAYIDQNAKGLRDAP